jgi:hypothetical protein
VGGGGLGADLGANWITIEERDPAWFTYGLDTSLGPISEDNPLGVVQFSNVSTSGGSLSFSTVDSISFSAVLPEPSSAALVGLGLAGLALRRLGRFDRVTAHE